MKPSNGIGLTQQKEKSAIGICISYTQIPKDFRYGYG